jgi:hypothetical protein
MYHTYLYPDFSHTFPAFVDEILSLNTITDSYWHTADVDFTEAYVHSSKWFSDKPGTA